MKRSTIVILVCTAVAVAAAIAAYVYYRRKGMVPLYPAYDPVTGATKVPNTTVMQTRAGTTASNPVQPGPRRLDFDWVANFGVTPKQLGPIVLSTGGGGIPLPGGAGSGGSQSSTPPSA